MYISSKALWGLDGMGWDGMGNKGRGKAKARLRYQVQSCPIRPKKGKKKREGGGSCERRIQNRYYFI